MYIHTLVMDGLQDMTNMYYAKHPEQLVDLPCGYNYRFTSCCMWWDIPVCHDADVEGVTVVHGNNLSFAPWSNLPSFRVRGACARLSSDE